MVLDWRGLQQSCKFASFLCPLGKRSYFEGPLLCGGPGQLPMLPLPRSGVGRDYLIEIIEEAFLSSMQQVFQEDSQS